jgi:hypothetical protein
MTNKERYAESIAYRELMARDYAKRTLATTHDERIAHGKLIRENASRMRVHLHMRQTAAILKRAAQIVERS